MAECVYAAVLRSSRELMSVTLSIDTQHVARDLGLRLEQVEATLALLDAGNTVPFITRYRKDQTGALDEEQIRHIQEKVGKLRALADRKLTILKSIQSQGLLTPELTEQIRVANSSWVTSNSSSSCW